MPAAVPASLDRADRVLLALALLTAGSAVVTAAPAVLVLGVALVGLYVVMATSLWWG
jgi:hypothetical protein